MRQISSALRNASRVDARVMAEVLSIRLERSRRGREGRRSRRRAVTGMEMEIRVRRVMVMTTVTISSVQRRSRRMSAHLRRG